LALQGTLDVVSVADVLRLLADTAKTGRLRLENDSDRGVVWLRAGRVTALTDTDRSTDTPIVEFLFWLTTRAGGSFTFDVDDQAPDADEPIEVSAITDELARLTHEWDELHQVVPSLDHRVGLVAHLPNQEVTINAERWPSVLAAASQPTVHDLGTRLGVGDLDALRAIRDLVSTGVVDVRPPAADEPATVGARMTRDPRPTPATAVPAVGRTQTPRRRDPTLPPGLIGPHAPR
jgi:uncharacterized protein DUF4388